MSFVSVGDLSQHYISQRNTGKIKTDLGRLGNELSLGQKADVTKSMHGDTRALTVLQHSLATADSFLISVETTTLTLTTVQSVLGQVDSLRNALGNDLVLLSSGSNAAQIDAASIKAKDQFGAIVSSLNQSWAGKPLFSGTALDTVPLAASDLMLADIVATIPDPTDPVSVRTAVSDWFQDPAGGFATMGFLGNSDEQSVQTGPNGQSVSYRVTADSDEIRQTLAAVALGAVVDMVGPSLTNQNRNMLLKESGALSLGAAQGMAHLQSRIGFTEEKLALSISELAATKTTMSIAVNELVNSDPFETATRLEAAQRQLELHFTATARLSRMSLADYL